MSMLVRLGVHKSPDHTKLAHQMVELFAPFFSTPLEASDGAKAVKDFHAIIAAATKLDIQLRQSKAHYRCFHHTTTPPKKPDYFGYSFDPNTMEQGNFGPRMDQSRPDSLPVVDLVLSPGLIKSGNADGKNYLSERVSVKMEVLCNLDYIFKLQFGEDDEDEVDETYQTPDSSLSKEDDQTSVGARQSTVRVKEESSDDGDMESDVDMFAVAAQLSDLYESGKVKMESM